MHRIFYLSRSLASPTDVESIVAEARQANARSGVTGALLYSGAHFAQMLEGPAGVVAETMARVERDKRHEGVTRLIDSPATGRRTDGWTMAFIDAPGADELIARLLADPGAAAARAEHLLDLLLAAVQDRPDKP